MFPRHARRIGLAFALVLLPGWATAQFDLAWARPSAGHVGAMLALDRADNVFSVGSSGTLATLIKHAPDGTLSWERTLAGASAARGVWVDADAQGNVVVLANQVSASSGASMGLIVAKFGPAGELLWQDTLTQSLAYGVRVQLDAAGNAYVLGVLPPQGGTSFNLLYKYAPSGSRQWAIPLGFRSPAAMALAPGGRVLATGYAATGLMAIEAYDSGTGMRLFSKTLPSLGGGQDIAVGPSGEFYAVGQVPSGPTGSVPGFLVVKHDAAFNELWRRSYAHGDIALRVAVDGSGHAIVTGRVGSYSDWMTLKLDAAGDVLWWRRQNLHLANDEMPAALLVQPDDSIVITGQTGPGPTTGNLSLTQAGTVRLLPADGAPQGWASHLAGVRGVGVRRASDNALYLLGAGEQTVYRYRQGGAGTASIDNWPVATARATSGTSGSAPLTVGFSSDGSMDPDGTGIFVQWDFGDGSLSSEPVTSHVYAAAGTYAATLKVTDLVGHAVQAAPIVVTVSDAPAAPPQPTALTLAATTLTGGQATTGTVVLANRAGATVSLRSSSSLVRVPASVVVPAGSDRAGFTISTSPVRRSTSVTLTARANGGSASASLTLTP